MSRTFHRWGRPEPVHVIPDPPGPDACTAVQAQAGVPDLHYYQPAETDCDHGATYTGPAVITLASTDYGHGLDSATVVSDPFTITLCLVCHHLAPTPQEDPQP